MHKQQTISFGALEYDALKLLETDTMLPFVETNFLWPEPLAPNVTLVDYAIRLFSKIFPILHSKRKLQLINHFYNGLKGLKQGPRLQAVC